MLKAVTRHRSRKEPGNASRNASTSAMEQRPLSSNGNGSVQVQNEKTQQLPTTEPIKEEHHHHHPHMPHIPGINPKIPHPKVKYIKHEGESGRSWFHPWHFIRIIALSHSTMSRFVNIFWPTVPVAIVLHFARPDLHVPIFIFCYLAMVPCANLIGFAGQELARKLPLVIGVILETFLASIVEIVLFISLIVLHYKHEHDMDNHTTAVPISVIRAAILGSILANLLLSLGFCFIAGGLRHEEQVFHEVVSEAGNGLLLVAGFALVIPAAFANSIGGVDTTNYNEAGVLADYGTEQRLLDVSRGTAVVLLLAWCVYMFYQLATHHSMFSEVLEADEERDRDRDRDLAKDKLTFTECVIALLLGITLVSLLAVFLVIEIEPLVQHNGVPDAFMGLILVPLVEKASEHLAAIDEAWDNQANFALAHVLGASLQTALFNTPLVVFVGWGLGAPMDLNFRTYEAVVLILAIVVVGSFLRDGKSNYLEGILCILIYIIVAFAAFYYPNPPESGGSGEGATGGESGAAEHAKRMLAESMGL